MKRGAFLAATAVATVPILGAVPEKRSHRWTTSCPNNRCKEFGIEKIYAPPVQDGIIYAANPMCARCMYNMYVDDKGRI